MDGFCFFISLRARIFCLVWGSRCRWLRSLRHGGSGAHRHWSLLNSGRCLRARWPSLNSTILHRFLPLMVYLWDDRWNFLSWCRAMAFRTLARVWFKKVFLFLLEFRLFFQQRRKVPWSLPPTWSRKFNLFHLLLGAVQQNFLDLFFTKLAPASPALLPNLSGWSRYRWVFR